MTFTQRTGMGLLAATMVLALVAEAASQPAPPTHDVVVQWDLRTRTDDRLGATVTDITLVLSGAVTRRIAVARAARGACLVAEPDDVRGLGVPLQLAIRCSMGGAQYYGLLPTSAGPIAVEIVSPPEGLPAHGAPQVTRRTHSQIAAPAGAQLVSHPTGLLRVARVGRAR